VVAALRIDTFGDTVIVVFALATAAMIGAAFGFRQAIRGVADYEDEKEEGRFVRWFVEGGQHSEQEWRGWGIGGVTIGVWLGGGCIVCLPIATAIWALWVR
jgi:hypothetical protein